LVAVRGTLIDTNVIVDYLDQSSEWFSFARIEDVEKALPLEYFVRAAIPWDAAFLAGKAFQQYRRRGGIRTSPLPDFFIGAHAAVTGMALLTRNPRHFRAYFPKLKIIAP